jgi:protein ImuA
MKAAEIRLSALRRSLAALEPAGPFQGAAKLSLGLPAIDEPLGGGLARAALHEFFAAEAPDATAAAGFAVALAVRAARDGRKILWVRHELTNLEAGRIHAPGLADFGANPDDFILVRARNAALVFRAGAESLRCSALAAVIIEFWGEPSSLYLNATRRFSLEARRSGVSAFLLRAGAKPRPSAAMTRWAVKAAPSTPFPTDVPGHPAFDLTLLRHRHGLPGRSWRVEWDRDQCSFRDPAPLPRTVASLPSNRPTTSSGKIRKLSLAG